MFGGTVLPGVALPGYHSGVSIPDLYPLKGKRAHPFGGITQVPPSIFSGSWGTIIICPFKNNFS